MKISEFLLSSLLSLSVAHFAHAKPLPPSDLIPEETTRVSCNDEEVGRAIAQHVQVVPSLLYHFGKRETLLRNVQNRKITPEVWSQYIRGDGPDVKQAPFRQGLYGCTHPYDCDSYADYQDPWMMAIKIRSECRKPEAVASFIGLTTDARTFLSPALRARLLKCYQSSNPEYPEHAHMIDGAAYPRTDCENALEEFLETNHIQIVQDGITIRSWYLRNPNCIETIFGTGKEILELFKQMPTENAFLCSETVRDLATGRESKMVMGGYGVKRVQENARKNP